MEFIVNVKKKSAKRAKSEVEQAIQWRILNDPANRLNDFTSDKNRARSQPLTHNRIKKTIFRLFYRQSPALSSSRVRETSVIRKSAMSFGL